MAVILLGRNCLLFLCSFHLFCCLLVGGLLPGWGSVLSLSMLCSGLSVLFRGSFRGLLFLFGFMDLLGRIQTGFLLGFLVQFICFHHHRCYIHSTNILH